MKALVLGGTRFIGPHVVHHLIAAGHEVVIYHRGQTETDLPPTVPHIHGALADLTAHLDEIRPFAPDAVLFMVPIGDEDSRRVMEAMDGVTPRLVAVTSQDVYRAYGRIIGKEPGPPDPLPLTEDSPLREKLYPYRGDTPRAADDPGRWADDYDKILVERNVMGHPRIAGTILRLPMVYGAKDGGRTFPYLKRMDDGRPTILLDESQAPWRWSRSYVEDTALAIALAVADDRAAGRIYNVAEEESFSEMEWVEQIAEAAGWMGKVVAVPRGKLTSDENFEQDLVVDSSRIRRELGFRERVPRAEALRRTVEWQRAHPPKKIDPTQFDYAKEDAILAEMA